MRMRRLFKYETRRGDFYLCQSDDGRFHPCFENEALGSYETIHQALEDLEGGYTFWPSVGDPSAFNIPGDLEDWERLFLES